MTKLVRAVFPALIVLRFADQQEPVMDRLYFYVRKMDTTLLKSKEILDEAQEQCITTSWRSIMNTDQYFSSNDGTDSSLSEYESETCTEEDSDTASTLGQQVIDIWNKRRYKLINDFTITGWLLSPVPEVYTDSSAHMTGHHRDAVDRLLKKMYASELADDSDELASLLNDFWDEFEQFKSKTGPFEKAYIWKTNNQDLQHGRSHLWHKKNSLSYTKVLGKEKRL